MRILGFALKNLRRRRVRTALTILGIAIAVSFVIGILSVTEGFMMSFERTVRELGIDVVVGQPGTLTEFMGTPAVIPQGYADQIQAYENVKAAIPCYATTVALELGKMPLIIRGIPPELFGELRPYAATSEGRLLTVGDEYAALLGYAVAQGEGLRVGDHITIHGQNFTVVGVLESTGEFSDFMVLVPLAAIQEVCRDEGYITHILIKVHDLDRVDETVELIERDFPDLNALTSEEVIAQMSELIAMERAFDFGIASVSLLIAILFVLCTMVMAVSERIREIGTLRAIGASRAYIFKLILAESIVISLIGGLIGCAGGYAMAQAIGFIFASMGWQIFQPVVTIRLLIIGVVIAFSVGSFAGLYPAWRASKQNIVEALRYE